MTRTCERGDVVLIGALAQLRGDDGQGSPVVDADGFEDGLLGVLDRDVTIDGGTLGTRVLLTKIANGDGDLISRRFLDAQRVALAILHGDEEVLRLVGPWLARRSHDAR